MRSVLVPRALLIALAMWCLGARAYALDPALHVQPGATCVTSEGLRAQIDTWLAGATVGSGMTIEVTGSETDPRVVGFVLSDHGRTIAKRSFAPGPSACAQLEASLALAIALALKVSLLEEIAPARPSWRRATSASAIALLGFAPRAPLGLQWTLDVGLSDRLWLRGGVGFWAAGDNQLPRAQGSFDLRGLAVRIETCGMPSTQLSWSLFGCLGARVGALWAHGRELTADGVARDPWFALSAAVGVSLHVSQRWSIDLAAALLGSLVRSRFEVLSLAGQRLDAYAIPRISSELSIGPRLQF